MYKINKNNKNKKFSYRIDMVVLSCVVVFISCFVIYMFRGKIEPGSTKPAGQTSTSDTSSQNDSVVVKDNSQTSTSKTESSKPEGPIVNPVPQSEKADFSYFDNCVFIGDSISVGLTAYNILSPDKVIASIGLNISKIDSEKISTTNGKLTAHEALIQKKPANIYIMLGSNGIAWMSNESMISKYSSFIDKIQADLPESKIYILSIPPVTEGREVAAENPIKNTSIDAYNSELLKLANDKNVYFVDINTALKNNLGKLDTEKAEKDGMHFKKATYDIMLDYILTHIAQ